MAQAFRDDNRIPTLLAVSAVDVATPTLVKAFPTINSLAVAIVDGSGNQISSFGGGTQYIDAASTVAHPTGTMPVFDNAGTISKVSNTIGLPVNVLNSSLAVTGTFWQATQPVSGTVSITANSAVNVAQMNGVAVTMGNGTVGTGVQRVAIASDNTVLPGVGAGATGAAVPANASYEGAIAKTALPAAGSDGNLVGTMSDKFGRQVILPVTIRDLVGTQTTTLSASTSETTIVTAGGAGVFNDLVMLVVSNTSASTNTRIDFRDTTAGTVLFSLQSVGGAAPVGFALPVPIPQTSANTNWTAQCATSTTDIRVYAVFAKQK